MIKTKLRTFFCVTDNMKVKYMWIIHFLNTYFSLAGAEVSFTNLILLNLYCVFYFLQRAAIGIMPDMHRSHIVQDSPDNDFQQVNHMNCCPLSTSVNSYCTFIPDDGVEV